MTFISRIKTSNIESSSSTCTVGEELNIASQPRKFTFNELKYATRNFRPESFLGEGGFGYFYKGWIEKNGTAPMKPVTGLTVAVKILNHEVPQGNREWLGSPGSPIKVLPCDLEVMGSSHRSSFLQQC